MKRSVIVVIAAMTAMLMLVSCSSKVEKLITEAETALYSGNYEDVVELCNEVIEADDDNQTAYYFRGCAYYELGNYNDAVDDCEKAVSFGKAEAYTHLWKSYMKLDDMVNTEKYLKESLDAGNTDVEIGIVNSIPAVSFTTESTYGIAFLDDAGIMYNVQIGPKDIENAEAYVTNIVCSLSVTETAESETEAVTE